MLLTRVRTLATTLAAMVVTVGLVLGIGTGITVVRSAVALVNTVLGIGGSSDPLSERLPIKLNETVVPAGWDYVGTEYPASLNLDRSVRIGMPVLHDNYDAVRSEPVLVAGYSLGALLVEQLKRDLADSENPPSEFDLSFLQIATPFIPNGGIFARFPGLSIPGVVTAMGPSQPTKYDTTYVINEYDTWGDFPAYFNPVALVNAVLGHEYTHIDEYYDPVDPADEANYVTEVENTAGGKDTYILVPTARLPLLRPLRDIAHHLGLTPVAERLIGLIEPLLKVVVDMAYTDRENLKPGVATRFSLFTPPHKIVEALNAVPGAVREGLENLVHGPRKPAESTADTDADTLSASDEDVAPETGAEAKRTPTLRAVTDEQPAVVDELSDTGDAEEEVRVKKQPRLPSVDKMLRDTVRTVFGHKRPTTKTEPAESSDPETGPRRSDKPADGKPTDRGESADSDQKDRDGRKDRDAGAEAA